MGDVATLEEVAELAGGSKRPLPPLATPIALTAKQSGDEVVLIIEGQPASDLLFAYCPSGSVDLTATEVVAIQRCVPATVFPDRSDEQRLTVHRPQVGVADPESDDAGRGTIDYVALGEVDGVRRVVAIATLT